MLYVLVCGKVPFDDQSMPALHAKIKRGMVEYPAWLSAECKHLLSRMLVTNPANRAALQEVSNHAWMTKGYDGPPNSHLPVREPLRSGELDPEVVKGMTGFEFGTPEEIEAKLQEVLTSELYLNALAVWDERKGQSSVSNGARSSTQLDRLDTSSPRLNDLGNIGKAARSPSKRFSGLGFYGKKLAGNVAAAFSGKADDSNEMTAGAVNGVNGRAPQPQTIGAGGVRTDLTDPTRGYHPLLSIYYLVREKIDRERIFGPGVFASSTLSLTGPPLPPSTSLSSSQPFQPGSSGSRYDYALGLAAPAPAATSASRDTRVHQPPAGRAKPIDLSESVGMASVSLKPPPPSVGEASYLARSASGSGTAQAKPSAHHQRSATVGPAGIDLSTATSPSTMQGGFRRTAAPDAAPPLSTLRRPSASSTPPAHRHSVHLGNINSTASQAGGGAAAAVPVTVTAASPISGPHERWESLSGTASVPSPSPTMPSGAGSFVKRFGSLLGRSDDGKKHSRQRNSISVASAFSPAASLSGSTNTRAQGEKVDSDVPLVPPAQGRSVSRASTTGGDLSPPVPRHLRGVSVDAAGVQQQEQRQRQDRQKQDNLDNFNTSPSSNRRRQASLSLSTGIGGLARRRPAGGSLAAGDALTEEDEDTTGISPDSAVATDLKPVYLKVSQNRN